MHKSCLQFVLSIVNLDRVKNKKLLEAGSYNANGSVREYLTAMDPEMYYGIDLSSQPEFVDEVADIAEYGPKHKNEFDTVLCLETLEHCKDWKGVVNGLKDAVKPNGLLIVTARGPGKEYHGHPHDYWRFTLEDFKTIFSDFDFIALKEDLGEPGVLFAGVKSGRSRPDLNLISVQNAPPSPFEKTDSTFAVAVITPTTGLCQMNYAQSLARLIMYFSQVQVFPGVEKQILIPDAVAGSGIAENYEELVLKYLSDKETYITHFLSIEDDMTFAPDCLHILARHRLPIVGANYSVNKGSPLRFTSRNNYGPCLTDEESTGLEEVTLLPQGFTLIAREVYEALPRPWYMMGYNTTTGHYIYQDYYFCRQAMNHGFKIYVDHDVSKKIGHVGPRVCTWKDAIIDERKSLANNKSS